MSIGSIAATPSYAVNPQQQQNPLSQLSQALQSGNLQAAQQAYASFTQNAPASQSGQSNPFGQAISQIGTALSSGDIAQAQSTLQSLQSQMKAHHGGHHHHKAGGAAATPTTSGTPAADPGADGTGVAPAGDTGVDLLA